VPPPLPATLVAPLLPAVPTPALPLTPTAPAPLAPIVPPELLPDPAWPLACPALPLVPTEPEVPLEAGESEPDDEQPNPNKTTEDAANSEGRRNRMRSWSLADSLNRQKRRLTRKMFD
jgi:hypothetical protein